MVYTQKDIQKLARGTYPGKTYEEQEKILRGIIGIPDDMHSPVDNLLPVEPKVQAFIDLNVKRSCDDIKDKEMCKTVEDNRRRYAWHFCYERILNHWDECQAELDKAGIRITE